MPTYGEPRSSIYYLNRSLINNHVYLVQCGICKFSKYPPTNDCVRLLSPLPREEYHVQHSAPYLYSVTLLGETARVKPPMASARLVQPHELQDYMHRPAYPVALEHGVQPGMSSSPHFGADQTGVACKAGASILPRLLDVGMRTGSTSHTRCRRARRGIATGAAALKNVGLASAALRGPDSCTRP